MPRSADAQPELALQGSLFGEPEPAPSASATGADPADAFDELSDAELGDDAAARPRRRSTTLVASDPEHDSENDANNESDDL